MIEQKLQTVETFEQQLKSFRFDSEDLLLELNKMKSSGIIEHTPIETFLYDKDYLNIPFKISEKQMEVIISADTDFVNHDKNKYDEFILLWGKGSCSFDSTIKDINGKRYTIGEMYENKICLDILSYNEETKQLEKDFADIPILEGVEQLYQVELEDGKKIEVTANHRFYTKEGWKCLKDLVEGDEILSYDN